MSYQNLTDTSLVTNQSLNKPFHNPRKVKSRKRFPGVSNVTQKHFSLESKRSKMLTKRKRSSKRKKWNQGKLSYLKKCHYLIEEKEEMKAGEFSDEDLYNMFFVDDSSYSDYSISSDDSSDDEFKFFTNLCDVLIRKNKEQHTRELFFEIPFCYLEKTQRVFSIRWFDSNNFKKIIDRCVERDININGIEIMDEGGSFITATCKEEYDNINNNSEPWFVEVFNKYSKEMKENGIIAQYSATYGF